MSPVQRLLGVYVVLSSHQFRLVGVMVCQVDGLGDGLNSPNVILTTFPDSETHEYTRKQVIELKSTNRF